MYLECSGNAPLGTSIQHVESILQGNCSDIFTWNGDLIVQGFVVQASLPSEGSSPSTLSLDPLQEITGNLEFNDIHWPDGVGGAWTVDTGNISGVGVNLTFSNLQQLEMPQFPHLQRTELLSFNDVEFTAALIDYKSIWPQLSTVTTLDLIDTSASSFGPLGLPLSPFEGSTFAWITVTGNHGLRSLHVDGYSNPGLSTRINIRDNTASPSVSFPSMTMGSFNISGVNDVSIPGVRTLGLLSSDFETQSISFNSFAALDLSNVSTAYGTIEIDSNPLLRSLDLSSLGTVSNLKITNNSQLNTIDLGNLLAVKSLDIEGPINTYVSLCLAKSEY